MSETVTTEILHDVGRKALRLADQLSWKKTGERWLHLVVLGLFEGKIGLMEREFPVELHRKVTRPKCIDFRHGGSNPAVIELVVRVHGNELWGQYNVSELRKLCKIPFSKARRRVLFLLDPSHLPPIEKRSLQESYNKLGPGGGNFAKETVTIVYVHPNKEYSFRWNP